MTRPQHFIFLNMLYLALMGGMEIWFHSSDIPLPRMLMISGTVACFFFAWYAVMDFKQRQMLHAVQMFSCGALLRVGIGGFYSGILIATHNEQYLSTMDYLPIKYMPHALFLMQISSSLFLIGSWIGEKKQVCGGSSLEDVRNFPSDLVIWLYVFVGWSMKILTLKGFPSLGVLGYVISILPLGAIFIFSLGFVIRQKYRIKYFVYLVGIIAGQFYLSRNTVMRESLAFIFLPVLLASFMGLKYERKTRANQIGDPSMVLLRRYKKNKTVSRLFIYGLVLILILFMVFILYPAGTMVKHGEVKTIDKAIVLVTSNLKQKISNVHHFPDRGIFSLAQRMSLIVVSPAIILQLMDRSVRPDFDPIRIIIAGFLPRFLWPDKPIISRGGWFARLLLPAAWNVKTAVAMTAPGELFWAYGIWGVILGMILMGFLVGKLWASFLKEGHSNPFALVSMIYISQECFRWFESEASASISLLLLLSAMIFLYSQLKAPHH